MKDGFFGALANMAGDAVRTAVLALDAADPDHVQGKLIKLIHNVRVRSGLPRDRQLRLLKILHGALEEIIKTEAP